jgi:hypothetical protein
MYEMSKFSDSEEDSQDEEGGVREALGTSVDKRRASLIGAGCCCLCCCVVLGGIIATNVALLSKHATCSENSGETGMGWNQILPSNATSQMEYKLFSWFWHQVDVYPGERRNASEEEKKIGFWMDLNLILDLQSRYAYVNEATEEVQLEARTPWGFYLGHRYDIWLCQNQEQQYQIEEDYWSRPWFDWSKTRKYNIKKAGVIVATSEHHKEDVWSFRGDHWEASVTSTSGQRVAAISQESQSDAGWFQYQRWRSENFLPDIIPNEVVSFLAAVYDINRAKKQEQKQNQQNHAR